MGIYSVRVDLSGKIFGRLKVLHAIEKTKPLKWLCECECGTIKPIVGNSLKNNEAKSCGCLRKEVTSIRRWGGYGEINKTYFTSIIRGANDRNILFDITIEYIWQLFLNQNRKCAISGVDLFFSTSKCKLTSSTASLDRIDSSKGYVEGNVQWVHKNINFMKREMSDSDFIEWCVKVANNVKKNN